jgi:RNAse (barnase) inhibitor barstar
MSIELKAIARGEVAPGIYHSDRLTPADLADVRTDNRSIVTRIDGSSIATTADLFNAFARELSLPDYFGHNWDGLADCLTDLDLSPTLRYLIIFDRLKSFLDREPQAAEILTAVCTETIAYWQQESGVEMYFIYCD